MKTTFRDAFIAHLQQDLLSIASMYSATTTASHELAEKIVVSVEKATNKRVTAKSPNWQFNKIVAALDKTLMGSSGKLDDVFQTIVRRSRMTAGNEIRGIELPADEEEPVSAVLYGPDFAKLLDVLKNFASKQGTNVRPSTMMLQMNFEKNENGKCVVKAYAANGYMIVEHEVPCVIVGKPFRAYINIPQLRPKRFDRVSVFIEGKVARVSFGDVSFRTRQPDNPMDLQDLKQKNALSGEKKTIFLNPTHLKAVTTAMCAAAKRGERIEVTLHGITEMVSFQCEGTDAMLCPMRPSREYYDSLAKEQGEAKAG